MKQNQIILVDGHSVTMDTVWEIAEKRAEARLHPEAKAQMEKSRRFIEKELETGEPIYGVNTGFGTFANVRISPSEIVQLQKNLIRSHCVGIGDAFSEAETRAIMFLRANALARGHSGIRPLVVEKILEFINNDLLPVIPQQGSVGASGDLAPLSHLALALIGEGQIWRNGNKEPAGDVLQEKGVTPLELQAKEGLSLINGCQVMTAVGLLHAHKARVLAGFADLAGAMSLEALRGSRRAFHPLVAATRPHPGEAKTARNLLRILGESSEISLSHEDCDRVQDAYSLRCMPAVHGAMKDTLNQTISVLTTEANSSTDNPLVFADEKEILSCGNFHGEPVAFALDFLAIAVSAFANMSECRIAKLINPEMSALPKHLTPKGGMNSGLMIVQVAAASLVSENKILAHPASVDSIPTNVDKEDHVSMGTIAARKLGAIVKNAENIISMEFLTAAQALDFLKPLRPAPVVEKAFTLIRTQVPFAESDRVFSWDIEAIKLLLKNGKMSDLLQSSIGNLEY